MKSIIISAVCLTLVFIYSIFTFNYVKNFKQEIDGYLPYLNDVSLYQSSSENIKKAYNNKKRVLQFILNNEQTDKLEELISSLENSVEFYDKQNISEYAKLINVTLDDIMHQNKCII